MADWSYFSLTKVLSVLCPDLISTDNKSNTVQFPCHSLSLSSSRQGLADYLEGYHNQVNNCLQNEVHVVPVQEWKIKEKKMETYLDHLQILILENIQQWREVWNVAIAVWITCFNIYLSEPWPNHSVYSN